LLKIFYHDVKTLKILFAITYIFLFSTPLRNYPLIDDFLYFEAVKNFLEKGAIEIPRSAAPTFILQLFYGSLFVQLFGLSHQTLMFSTVVISGFGVAAAYYLFRRFFSSKLSFFCSLLILVNPVYFYLSHTFMTDIPSFVFGILALTFYVRAEGKHKAKFIFLGTISAIAAFLIRQFYIILVFAMLLYLFIKSKRELVQPKIFISLVILPFFAIALWLTTPHFFTFLIHQKQFIPSISLSLPNNLAKGFYYIGLFLFPFGIFYLLNIKKSIRKFLKLKKTYRLILIFVFILTTAWFFIKFVNVLGYFPGNIIQNTGIGPVSLQGSKASLFPKEIFLLIGSFSILTAFFLSIDFLSVEKLLLFRIVGVAYFVMLVISGLGIDRYFLFLLPIGLIFLTMKNFDDKNFFKIIISTILIFATWSYFGTLENFAWNDVKWQAIDFLLSSGVEKTKIDGGSEFNAMYKTCADSSQMIKCEYLIAFEPMGLNIEKQFTYKIFGKDFGNIYVLRGE
jgi:4-amino-4-deoxy-L-arabinose transferase-like glycosyltransferase